MRFTSLVFPLLLVQINIVSCSESEDRKPLTGEVTVAIPQVHYPRLGMKGTAPAPIIELHSVARFPSSCYRISYSKWERSNGRITVILGDAVRDAGLCNTSFEPAWAFVSVDSVASNYSLILVLGGVVDEYVIEIEPDYIRLTPIVQNFTVPVDSVWLR